MWSRNEPDPQSPPVSTPLPDAGRPAPGGRPATLGPSLFIKGDLTGDEDLLVEGRVDGTIALPQHSVSVGPNGRVKADIQARHIRIEGQVEGDLVGAEEVVIRKSGKVLGNVSAPRVTLENGAKFRGSIDMQPDKAAAAASASTSAPGERKSRVTSSPPGPVRPGAAQPAAQRKEIEGS